MSIRDYLHINRLTASSVARKLGVHPSYLRMIKNGHYVPSEELALKIEILTGGQVTLAELRPAKVNEDALI